LQDDTLDGGACADTLDGGEGNDVLLGGLDCDVLFGGSGQGFDIASYADADSGVVANLSNPSQNTGEAAGDTYISIEGLKGSKFDDTLIGNILSNLLNGGSGNDVLDGGSGADTLLGGTGYDFASYMHAGTGVVANLSDASQNRGQANGDRYEGIEGLLGSQFHDTLTGGEGYNELFGQEGDDVLRGLGGGDWLVGGGGHDALEGGEGDDVLDGGWSGHDWLYGGTGRDELYGRDGDDVLDGGSGADGLDGGAGYDYASYATASSGVTVRLWDPWANTGDAAGDTFSSIEGVHGSLHADTLEGNGGDNYLFGRGGHDVVAGLDGNDFLFGEAGHDTLAGGTGIDALSGGDGCDRLVGGAGADRLDGGQDWDSADYSGAAARVVADLILIGRNAGEAQGDSFVSVEEVLGSRHDDELYGDTSGNALRGDAGHDVLEGRGGWDHLDGGEGEDYAVYSSAAAGVRASLLDRFLNTGDAWGDTYVSIEGLAGSGHSDWLQGSDAGNGLYGHDGNDELRGEGGQDFLSGGAQADTLVGGEGADWLNGGAGRDTFRFETAAVPGTLGVDTIQDFSAAEGDRIELETHAFGRAHVVYEEGYALNAALKSTEFSLGTAASASTHRVIYDQASGALYYDVDGVGGAAQIKIAQLAAHTALSASNIGFYTL
jgi:Ca2+-binding RTX toxin-like protein